VVDVPTWHEEREERERDTLSDGGLSRGRDGDEVDDSGFRKGTGRGLAKDTVGTITAVRWRREEWRIKETEHWALRHNSGMEGNAQHKC